MSDASHTDSLTRGSSSGLRVERSPAMPTRPYPQYRWPSERDLVPTHCDNCQKRLLCQETPTASYPTVDVVCLYCTRTACGLIADGIPSRMTREQFQALPAQRGRPRGPASTYSSDPTEAARLRLMAYRERQRALGVSR